MGKLLLLELNEFNVELLEKACGSLELPNLSSALKMTRSRTWTPDEVEHDGLDPWVQWVSVHTGVDSSRHHIKRLGDVPDLDVPQIWETLSESGVTTGIWGAMNASRGRAALCRFFLPDPWTFSEEAYPSRLNWLLRLPRYYSKNYLQPSWRRLLSTGSQFFAYALLSGTLFRALPHVPLILNGVARLGLKDHVLFSAFDLLSALAFVSSKKRDDPDFCLIFCNSIAHFQHHAWSPDEIDDATKFTMTVIDRVIGILRRSMSEGEELIVMNGLTQRNIAGLKKDTLYRQINPATFLQAMRIPNRGVEQLMTHDAHVLFDTEADAKKAAELLDSARINDTKMFQVELGNDAPDKLFYQLLYWGEADDETMFLMGNETHRFFDHFEAVVVRTGEHVQDGDVFTSSLALPSRLANHDVAGHITGFLTSGGQPREEPLRAASG